MFLRRVDRRCASPSRLGLSTCFVTTRVSILFSGAADAQSRWSPALPDRSRRSSAASALSTWAFRNVTLQSRCISLRTGGSEDETIGRCEDVVDGAVRTRAGQGLGGVGASDVARLLAGRPDPGGTDESGGRAGSVPGGCAATVRGPAVRPQQLRCGGRVGVVCAGEPGDAGRGPPSIAEVEAF